jgi:hypothetical protein
MSTVEERKKAAVAQLDKFEEFFTDKVDNLTPEVCREGAKLLRELADLLDRTALDPELIVVLNKRL